MTENLLNLLLKDLKTNHRENERLSDQVLSTLKCLFPRIGLGALDLVDNCKVEKLIGASTKRSCFKVIGSSRTPYFCYISANYCSCPAFKYSVLRNEENYTCKHVLAALLSDAMNLTKNREIPDKELSEILRQM
uniref:SWIM-type domain-containing protein n=1 Tax=Strigamia maritima TaxID=126957 RepID=T1JE24_STRMM